MRSRHARLGRMRSGKSIKSIKSIASFREGEMKRWLLASTIAAAWLSVATLPTSSAGAGAGIAPRGSCAGLTGLSLPDTQILSATQKTGYCTVIGVINKRVSSQDPDHFTYGIG